MSTNLYTFDRAFIFIVTWLSFNICQAAGIVDMTLLDQNGQALVDGVVYFQVESEHASLSGKKRIPSNLIMDQKNRQFAPHVLIAQVGDLVSFPNSDNIRHHVYSFSEPKRFEIKLYADKPESPIKFETPGVVALGCNIHDSMLGYILVIDTPYASKTDSKGRASLAVPEKVPSEFFVWHPLLKNTAKPLKVSEFDVNSPQTVVIEIKSTKKTKFNEKRWR